MADTILNACRLSLFRGSRQVFDNFSIDLNCGVTAILGPNGAGKTTLLNALVAPANISSGTLQFEGNKVPLSNGSKTYLSRVGHMPQDWRYFSGYTAIESVEYAGWLKCVPGASLRFAAEIALREVGLEESKNVKIRRMSGGMRQRVGLAEAIVNNPALVVLDEPTVGLDPAQRMAFRRALLRRSATAAVVLSTHLTDDVEATADRVIVLADGKLKFDGSPRELSAFASGSGDEASTSLERGYLHVLER